MVQWNCKDLMHPDKRRPGVDALAGGKSVCDQALSIAQLVKESIDKAQRSLGDDARMGVACGWLVRSPLS